jgi:phosphoglycolate phosphatase-like HAD superfamily hydrolase
MALAIMNNLVNKQNCFMIGDRYLDINAVKAANILHIAVYSWYENKVELEKDVLQAVMKIRRNII